MKAKIKKRLEDQDNRVQLGTVLPLSTPYVLMIDPSSLCNHKCLFCPTGDRKLIKSTGRYQGVLDFDVYKKTIDDTASFANPVKVLRLYKVGEPLLNPYFADMVMYARNKKNILKIETTTNGMALSPKSNEKIISAGINQINISVNGVSESQIFHYTRTKIDFKKYVENIKNLYEQSGECEIYVKAIKQNLTEDEQKKFYDVFGNISDRIFLENLSPAWPEYTFEDIPMSFEEGHYGQRAYERKVCPFIFYVMVVNSDGSVSTCVQDWKQQMIVGNVKHESLHNIWLGSKLDKYRLNHLDGNKCLHKVCEKCEVMSYGVIDDIDQYANKIKNDIRKSLYK